MNEFFRSFRVIVLLGFVLGLCTAASATKLYKPEPEFVMNGDRAKPFAFIERHVDPHPRFPYEPFHPKLVQFYPQVIEAFGTKEPDSKHFLLHVMPGYDKATKPVPVLLLPGSNDDSSRRYAYPLATTHPDHLKKTGLAVYLARHGYAVFAITWSHFHGCNVHQGEQVANAITRIRTLLGRESDPGFQVDLITYSKGAMAARCYVQSACEFYGYNYLTRFRNDVRRVVFQVGPIGGLDTMFRYYLYNVHCQSNDVPAPLGVSKQVLYGMWKDAGILDIHSGYWPGQLQMIHDTRLVGVDYCALSWTAGDMNMTMTALRDGGSTFFVKSHGLEAARQAGGCLIERLNDRGFPPDVSACLVCGTHQVIYNEQIHWWPVPMGAELTDASDGLVFLKSASYKEGLTAQGASVDVKTFNLNHMEVSRSQEVFEYVDGQLSRP